MAQGAHRGRPVAAAPCTPGLRPAPPCTPGLRPAPAVSATMVNKLTAGRTNPWPGKATATTRHKSGSAPDALARRRCACRAYRLPRPSGNVSAILPPPGKNTGTVPDILPGGAALARADRQSEPDDRFATVSPWKNGCSALFPGRWRSRLIFCVMSLLAQGAHRGRPVATFPLTLALRPAPLAGKPIIAPARGAAGRQYPRCSLRIPELDGTPRA